MLLDINMPVMDGLEAVKLIKKRYDDCNKRILETQRKRGAVTNSQLIVRPMLVHLTQLDYGFQTFITQEEKADMFLQKPLSQKDFIALLRLVKLK